MDTWTTTNNKMWLRDLLPVSEYFAKSRVMTFGYDSDLTDHRSVMRIENWAQSLLDSVNQVRLSNKVHLSRIFFDSSYADISSRKRADQFCLSVTHSEAFLRGR